VLIEFESVLKVVLIVFVRERGTEGGANVGIPSRVFIACSTLVVDTCVCAEDEGVVIIFDTGKYLIGFSFVGFHVGARRV
jgi:hypothetical protein